MKNKFKWSGLLALVGFLSLASGTASAAIINFSFHNVGSIDSITSCGFGCNTVQTSGDLKVGGEVVGTFEGTMKLLQTGWVDHDVTSGSTWSFLDTSGLNNLFGTLTGDLWSLVVLGGGSLSYDIDGGSGFFAGASGGGASTFGFLGTKYDEKGWLSVNLPDSAASVPEPGVTTLLLAGMGMLGFVAYRRRRAQSGI